VSLAPPHLPSTVSAPRLVIGVIVVVVVIVIVEQ
jgi:hypothetical protein